MIISYFPINVFILSILGYDLIWWEENVEHLRLPQSRNHTHRHFHRLYIIFCGMVRVSWIYDKAEFQPQIVGNMNTVDLQNCRNKISRLSILLEYVNTFYTNLMWIRVICSNHRKLLNLYKLTMHIYVSLRLHMQNAVPAQPCVGKYWISLILLNFLHCNFRLWFKTP